MTSLQPLLTAGLLTAQLLLSACCLLWQRAWSFAGYEGRQQLLDCAAESNCLQLVDRLNALVLVAQQPFGLAQFNGWIQGGTVFAQLNRTLAQPLLAYVLYRTVSLINLQDEANQMASFYQRQSLPANVRRVIQAGLELAQEEVLPALTQPARLHHRQRMGWTSAHARRSAADTFSSLLLTPCVSASPLLCAGRLRHYRIPASEGRAAVDGQRRCCSCSWLAGLHLAVVQSVCLVTKTA